VITTIKKFTDPNYIPDLPGALGRSLYQGIIDEVVALTNAELADKTTKCKVIYNGNQSCPNGSDYDIVFNTAFKDVDGCFSTGSPTVLTIKKAGEYLAIGNVTFLANATGDRNLVLQFVRSSAPMRFAEQTAKPTGLNISLNLVGRAILQVGDTVKLTAFQNTGGSLGILVAGEYSPSLTLIRIGD